jgi:hypothetical protein
VVVVVATDVAVGMANAPEARAATAAAYWNDFIVSNLDRGYQGVVG